LARIIRLRASPRIKNPHPPSRSVGFQRVGRGNVQKHPHHNREPRVFVVALTKCFAFRPDWHRQDRAIQLVQQYQQALDEAVKDPDLHQQTIDEAVKDSDLHQQTIDEAVKDSDLLPCLVFCRHCGIRFLTHPRNARREDLHCPFGCRLHHRREDARRRSGKYIQTPKGRKAKKALNGRRSCPVHEAPQQDAALCASDSAEPINAEPINAEPINAEPVNAEPINAEPINAEPINAEPVNAEPVNAEPVNADPVNADPVNADPEADTFSVTFQSLPSPPFRVAIEIAGMTLDEDDVKRSSALSYVRMLLRVLEEIPLSLNEVVEWLLQCMRSRSIGRRNRKTYALGFLNEHPP
jgi:hypothetical protein